MINSVKLLYLIIWCNIFVTSSATLLSQNNESNLSAADILAAVRSSYGNKSQTFRGEIRPRKIGFKLIPLNITLSAKLIRLDFFESNRSEMEVDEIIKFEIIDRQYEITRIKNGVSKKLELTRFNERIRSTDLTYEDLAMRFIEWPRPKIFGVEKAKGDKAWKIRCTNPDTSNGYSFVDAWVSQRSGALVRMNGYNAKSQIVKSFEVDSVQKYKGDWYLEMMHVRTFPADAKSKPTSSYLKLKIEK